MAPQTKYEFILVNIKFSRKVNPKFPKFKYNYEKGMPVDYLYKVDLKALKWAFDMLIFEYNDGDKNIYYTEWDITSGDIELFKMHGDIYDQIHLVLYDDVAHWLYNSKNDVIKNDDGWGNLPVSYCGCCFKKQYKQIIEAIKALTAESCPCCR